MSVVFKRVADTTSRWIIACDANMDPNELIRAIGKWSPELKLKLRCKEAPRIVLRAQEEWTFGKRQITVWRVNHLKENREGRCGQRVSYVPTQGSEMHGYITGRAKS